MTNKNQTFPRQVGKYTLLGEATHPVTGITYKIGDNIVLEDDHIMYGSGKDYIITINTIFTVPDSIYIFISDKIYKDEEYKREHWASRPTGIFLNGAKRIISQKEINQINKAKWLANKYV